MNFKIKTKRTLVDDQKMVVHWLKWSDGWEGQEQAMRQCV